jgi:hypothetical protein
MLKPLPNYLKTSRAHYLNGKPVQWSTLERIRLGKSIEIYRKEHSGHVIHVSPCGGVAVVKQHDGIVEVEVCELSTVC